MSYPDPFVTDQIGQVKTALNQLNNVNGDTALGQSWFH